MRETIARNRRPETAAPGARTLAGDTWPLIGRDDELGLLRRALTGPRPRSVILAGPAGVGKTRLAREAMRVGDASGHPVRWITATRSVTRTPFGVLAPLMAPGLADNPDLADSFEDLLQRSARALTALGGDGRLLLFVDDAQLLDDASAGLIQQLVSTDAVLVVATVRTGEPTPAAVTALWKDELAVRIGLRVLDDSAINSLLTAVLGGQVDRAAVADLATRCQGNVLYLRELVRGALADGTLVDAGGLWRMTGPLAPSERIVELVDTRLAGVSRSARDLLELLAYSEPLGGAALDLLAPEHLIDDLQREGLLDYESDGGRVQIRLSHPLYADVLRAQTPPVRTAAMARSLAGIAAREGGDHQGNLLQIGIWLLDGGGGEPHVLLQAARAARWQYDFPLAERLARAAVDAGAGFDARLLAAQVAALRGRPEQAESELAVLSGEVEDDDQRARVALSRIDGQWLSLARMHEGLRIAEEAEASIVDPELRAEISSRRAGLLLGSAGPGAAVAALEPHIPGAEGRSLVWIGVIAAFGLGRLGRLAEGLDIADRACAAGVALREPGDWYPWYNIHGRCEVLAQAGRFAEAERLAREQHRRGLDEGSSEARAWFLWNLSRTTRDRGNVVSAMRDAREAATLLQRLGRRGVHHTLLSVLAQAQALAGDAVGARTTLAEAESLEIEVPGWSRTDHLAAQAWTSVAEGSISQGHELLDRAATLGEQIGDLTGAAAALHDIARIGAPGEARKRLAGLACRIEGDLVAARLAHVEALADRDARRIEGAGRTFEELGAELLAAEAAADAAVAWRRAGDVRRAEAGLHRAAVLAEKCEGVVTPALAPMDTRVRLTDAERETALLAASGLTNGEIAAQLQLSSRTVGNRLQRTYQKLGIRCRTDLARLVR